MATRSNGYREVTPRAFVAAATKIDLNMRRTAAKQGAKPQAWQADAWDAFDEVPEIKESGWYLGNQMAKLRLFPAVILDGVVVPTADEQSGVSEAVSNAAAEELGRLRSMRGGQADILRKLELNLLVAGECYIVGWAAQQVEMIDDDGEPLTVDMPEDWQVRSVDEVENKAGQFYVKEDPDTQSDGRLVKPKIDTIIRVWLEHPRHQALADSLVRALVVDARTVSALTQQVYAEALSRHSAGMILVPIELSFGPENETESEDGAESKRDVFAEEYEASVVDPITDNASVAQVQSMIVRGQADLLDKVRHIPYGRQTDSFIDERINGRVQRIARGLPLPIEKIMGHMQTTFANAAQIDEDEFEDYLAPQADILMDAITFAFFQPQLRENPTTRADADRIVVGYDPSALIAQPDPAESADYGLEKGLVSGDAWRRVKGWTEEDAPDPIELLVGAGLRRGILTADLTLALLKLMPGSPKIDMPEAVQESTPPAPEPVEARLRRALELMLATMPAALPPGPLGEPPGEPLSRPTMGALPGQVGASSVAQGLLGAARRGRPSDAGRRLAAIDRDLMARLTVAASDAMERALEKIGNVLRTKASAYRAITANVPRREVASMLGRDVVTAAAGDPEDLFAGAWDDLEKQFLAWGENAQKQAMDIAMEVTSGFSVAEREALALRQADDLGQAWSWMKGSLSSLGAERLFNPNPTVPEIGEFDPNSKVPTGLVRQAVQRAGGATGITSGDVPGAPGSLGPGKNAFIALTDVNGAPQGGIGTGELVNEVLVDGGAGVEGYVWVYGPARRLHPFEPHVELDGVEFVNFDDDVLANSSGFPEVDFYFPGDHSGCICDFEPVILAATDVDVAEVNVEEPVSEADVLDFLAGPAPREIPEMPTAVESLVERFREAPIVQAESITTLAVPEQVTALLGRGEMPSIDNLLNEGDGMLLADARDAQDALGRAIYNMDTSSGMTARLTEVIDDNEYGIMFQGEVRDSQGHLAGNFSRVLRKDEFGALEMHHDLFVVDPDFRGQGFAAEFNRHVEEQYARMGVEKITLDANIDIGGYAWARQGYGWDLSLAEPELFRGLAGKIDELTVDYYGFTGETELVNEAFAIAEKLRTLDPTDPDFPTPFDIANLGRGQGIPEGLRGAHQYELGKELLVGSRWPGVKVLAT